MKNDRLDALIMMSAHVLAEENERSFLTADTSDTVRPKSLDRKIKRILRRERRKREQQPWYTIVKNTAAGILTACTVTFLMMMSMEAVRTAVGEALLQWYDDYIAVMYTADSKIPASIETPMQPTSPPSEWQSTVIADTSALHSIRYSYNGELMISYHQGLLNEENIWADNDNVIITDIKIGKTDGKLFSYTNDTNKILLWTDGSYSFALSA